MDFPKTCTRARFGPSVYLKQISEYYPANNSISDDNSWRQRQHRHSAEAAQHNTHAGIATLNPASHLVYPQPEIINLRVQHHQQRWRWSEASRSRGAACLCQLLLEREPSCIYEDRTHSTQHTTKQKQHSTTQTISTPTANPTTAQLAGGKRPRDSSYPDVLCGQRAGALTSFVARSRSCTLVLRL